MTTDLIELAQKIVALREAVKILQVREDFLRQASKPLPEVGFLTDDADNCRVLIEAMDEELNGLITHGMNLVNSSPSPHSQQEP